MLPRNCDFLVTITLESGCIAHNRKPWHRNRIIIAAVIQRAVKGTCRLRCSIAVFDHHVLAEMNSGGGKWTHSADVTNELNALDLTAIAQINQATDVRGVRESKG